MQQAKLTWIEALRGLAALMIVIVHDRFILHSNEIGKIVAETALLPLAMGVDLFFMLSGFIMVITTSRSDPLRPVSNVWSFLVKRFARVWPLYTVVSIVAVFLQCHNLNGFYDIGIVKKMLKGLLFLPSAPQIYFDMFIPMSWTLCFEVYFYLIFALSFFFKQYRYVALIIWFVLTLLVYPFFNGSGYSSMIQFPSGWPNYMNLAINPIIWEFVWGMLAAWIYQSKIVIRSATGIYIAMAVSIGCLLIYWPRLHMLNFHGPFGWGALVAIVFMGITLLAKNADLHIPAWSVWLGKISYSLYLTHYYTFGEVDRLIAKLGVSADIRITTLFLLKPFIAIMIAALFYKYIENPASSWVKKALLNSPMSLKRLFFRSSKALVPV